jgi:MFS family permease
MSATRTRARAVTAAVIGTVFEWFDFFLYGSLVAVFGRQFFPPGHETAGLLAALAAYGAGFVVRPLGALYFGRMGDRIGRKRAFLVTISLMGGATVAIGLLPTWEQVGLAAPILLVLMRLTQGFAVGGEFGGAATYVAEHARQDRRALYTSLIMATGTAGLLLALAVIGGVRLAVGAESFEAWGWRIPFLLSVLLLAFAVWIRLSLGESPLFERARSEGRLARSPLREAFATPAHVKSMVVALVTLTMAQGAVWNAGQFYPLVFLQATYGLDVGRVSLLMGAVLLPSMLLFPMAGWLADRLGRRPVVIAGLVLSALVILPIYRELGAAVAPEFDLVRAAAWLLVLNVPVAMVCAPASAYLVELFPTRVRYSAMGLPYHVGNGVFGGFMAFAATALSTRFGDPFAGLWYPVVLAAGCAIAAIVLMPETRDRDLAA